MTRPLQITLGAALALIVALAAWRLLRPAPAEPAPPAPAALVTLAPARAATIGETVVAYGVIAGSTAASRTVAAPRGVIVERLLVAPGQPVGAGAPLIELAPTPASELAFRQASDAAAFAARDLERVQRLFDQHLAANDQLGAARKTLADARAALTAQSTAGGGHRQTLTAPFAGVVGTIPVALGDHVAPDAPLLSVIATGGLTAQLGVEPARAAKVAPGQAVVIASAFDPARGAASRIAIVARQVDPATRLVTVSAPAASTGLPLGAAVQGTITVAGHPGLVVPRAAIVRDEAGAHVFVAKGGKARQTAVTLGLEQGEDIEVVRGVAAGEAVVVQGAYQLEDGMALRIAPR